MPKVFHYELELGLSNTIIKVIPNIKVKFGLWHLYRALKSNKNKYCNAADLDDNVNLLFKCITNLAFVDPQYTIKLYDVIFQKNTNENFKKFLKYFKKYILLNIITTHGIILQILNIQLTIVVNHTTIKLAIILIKSLFFSNCCMF